MDTKTAFEYSKEGSILKLKGDLDGQGVHGHLRWGDLLGAFLSRLSGVDRRRCSLHDGAHRRRNRSGEQVADPIRIATDGKVENSSVGLRGDEHTVCDIILT